MLTLFQDISDVCWYVGNFINIGYVHCRYEVWLCHAANHLHIGQYKPAYITYLPVSFLSSSSYWCTDVSSRTFSGLRSDLCSHQYVHTPVWKTSWNPSTIGTGSSESIWVLDWSILSETAHTCYTILKRRMFYICR